MNPLLFLFTALCAGWVIAQLPLWIPFLFMVAADLLFCCPFLVVIVLVFLVFMSKSHHSEEGFILCSFLVCLAVYFSCSWYYFGSISALREAAYDQLCRRACEARLGDNVDALAKCLANKDVVGTLRVHIPAVFSYWASVVVAR